MGHFCNRGGLVDVLLQRLARAVEHQRREPAVERDLAFLKRITVVQMGDHWDRGVLGQVTEHLAQNGQRRVFAAAGAGLQDHWGVFGLGGGHVGAHVFPAQGNKAAHGITLFISGGQDVFQRDEGHLNFAIMSLMPGIVSI